MLHRASLTDTDGEAEHRRACLQLSDRRARLSLPCPRASVRPPLHSRAPSSVRFVPFTVSSYSKRVDS